MSATADAARRQPLLPCRHCGRRSCVRADDVVSPWPAHRQPLPRGHPVTACRFDRRAGAGRRGADGGLVRVRPYRARRHTSPGPSLTGSAAGPAPASRRPSRRPRTPQHGLPGGGKESRTAAAAAATLARVPTRLPPGAGAGVSKRAPLAPTWLGRMLKSMQISLNEMLNAVAFRSSDQT